MAVEQHIAPQSPEDAAALKGLIEDSYRTYFLAEGAKNLGILGFVEKNSLPVDALVKNSRLHPRFKTVLPDTLVNVGLFNRDENDEYGLTDIGRKYLNPDLEVEEAVSARVEKIKLGKDRSYAVFEAVKLGIPNILRDQEMTVQEIAQAVDTKEISEQELDYLVQIGVCEKGGNRFRLSSVGRGLWDEVPNAQGKLALLYSTNTVAWEQIEHTLTTGQAAFEHHFGNNFFKHIGTDSEMRQIFFNAMSARLAVRIPAILEADPEFFTLKDGEGFYDIGCGQGDLGIAVLQLPQNQEAHGTLFDQPVQVDPLEKLVREKGLSDRLKVVGGDFFKEVPTGKGKRIAVAVFHDWDQEPAEAIMKVIAGSMSEGDEIAVGDFVVPTRVDPSVDGSLHPGLSYYWHMSVVVGGIERTLEQIKSLFEQAGLEFVGVIPTRAGISLSKARKPIAA